MGFFDILLGRGFRNPPKEKWEGIVNTIHERLSEERQAFFDGCVEMLRMTPGATVKNMTMSPRVEMGIAVYQIYLGRELIAGKEYIPAAEQELFASLLYAIACSHGSPTERSELIHRYWPRQDNSGSEIFIFYSDIAQFITGLEKPAKETMMLSVSTISRFTVVSRAAFASTFGDRKTVRELKKSLSKSLL